VSDVERQAVSGAGLLWQQIAGPPENPQRRYAAQRLIPGYRTGATVMATA
jgi:hypothetical protein